MKFKLDENLTDALIPELLAIGHDAMTCEQEGIGGEGDSAILAHATTGSRVLITCDLDFCDIRRYPPGSHEGVVVLRLRSSDIGSIHVALGRLFATVDEADFTGNLIVVRDGGIRIRKPTDPP